MDISPLPHLATLHTTPSWHNNAGRVDRSACVEVRVSEVRRMAGCVRFGWERNRKGCLVYRWVESRPLPMEQVRRTFSGREAAGLFHVDLSHVEAEMGKRLPQRLEGDFRTERANAMRGPWSKPTPDSRGVLRYATRFRGQPQGVGTAEPRLKDGRRIVAGNPNVGATRRKALTLDRRWQQPVRIEKWRQRNSILPFYYLVCPGRMPWWDRPGWRSLSTIEPWLGEEDPRCPRLSTAPLGAKAKGCPQRVLFLMMPLATAEELADAARAQAWLASLPAERWRKHEAAARRLVARYGLLFEPRTFVCRRCLGVRYGEDPEGARLRKQMQVKRKWLPLATPGGHTGSTRRRDRTALATAQSRGSLAS